MKAKDIIDKYQLDKRVWTPKTFQTCLHTFMAVGEVPLKPWEYHGVFVELTAIFVQGDTGYWYWHEKDMTRLREVFVDEVNKNPAEITRLQQEWEALLPALDNLNEKVETLNLSTLSDDDLYALYGEWFGAYIKQYSPAVNIQDAFSMRSADFLEPHFQKLLGDKYNEQFPLLMSPVVTSFLQDEEKELLRILKDKQAGKDIAPALEAHAKKWHYLQNNYKVHRVLQPDYFLKQLEDMNNLDPDKEMKKINNELARVKREKKALLEELQLDPKSLNLVRITETFAAMQDKRKSYAMKCVHHQFLFMEEYARRTGWTVEEMGLSYFRELPDVMASKVTKKDLEQRRKFCGAIRTENDFDFMEGDLAHEVHNTVFVQNTEDVTEVRGSVASQGTAIGKVRIIHTAADAHKLQDGEIIVTSMTRPDIVFAMKKAAAIVTDEGGVTSHAAIVSRELKKPCIIGANIAMNVFKDGDTVEVDADEGVVRKV